ncbi:hypothetical protein SAMN02745195_01183 [Thermoanaerobacter uzonensis DSM 18761]|jgi:cytochrome b subunit of formate dehydrogenase|uniref:Uncharacterized protein n=1 Tax=Thermoanaerobacter uzonensis DSM 18761 TaxID=1123369 RepID=A0A1M4WJT4_9THEO|nr:hypothetical protein SAMN02745195_01183 [Thermoanaerobacter uzonensis DSM 18761]
MPDKRKHDENQWIWIIIIILIILLFVPGIIIWEEPKSSV